MSDALDTAVLPRTSIMVRSVPIYIWINLLSVLDSRSSLKTRPLAVEIGEGVELFILDKRRPVLMFRFSISCSVPDRIDLTGLK
jgi:hypothetical protein